MAAPTQTLLGGPQGALNAVRDYLKNGEIALAIGILAILVVLLLPLPSWLLDLTARALRDNPSLSNFTGHVSDSGEGRWTLDAAIDESVPAPVLSAALFARFSSRGESEMADRLLSAMRYEFGGHRERVAGGE